MVPLDPGDEGRAYKFRWEPSIRRQVEPTNCACIAAEKLGNKSYSIELRPVCKFEI